VLVRMPVAAAMRAIFHAEPSRIPAVSFLKDGVTGGGQVAAGGVVAELRSRQIGFAIQQSITSFALALLEQGNKVVAPEAGECKFIRVGFVPQRDGSGDMEIAREISF